MLVVAARFSAAWIAVPGTTEMRQTTGAARPKFIRLSHNKHELKSCRYVNNSWKSNLAVFL